MNHALYTARILVVALVLPLILTAVALIIGFTLASQLPGTIVVHWDLAGKPNGYGSPYSLPITLASVCLPLVVLFGGAVILLSHRGPLTPLAKLIAVVNTWHVLVISVLVIGELLYPGIGAAPGLALLIAFGGATAVAAVLWFVLPPGVRGVAGTVHPASAPVTLAEGERASWIRTTTASRAFIWTFAGVYVLVGIAISLTALSNQGRYWWLSFVPVVVIVVVLSNPGLDRACGCSWRARSQRGRVSGGAYPARPRDLCRRHRRSGTGPVRRFRDPLGAEWSARYHRALGRGTRGSSQQRAHPGSHCR